MLHFLISLTAWTALAAAVPSPPPPSTNGRFHVDQVRNAKFRHNGPAEYARALSKYGAPLPKGLARTLNAVSKMSGDDGKGVSEVPAWPQENDLEYLAPVMVGDPGQMVMMNLDTGSSDTWMYYSGTYSGHRGNQTYYSPELSNSSQFLNGTRWYITYGDGTFAYGDAYKDIFSIGDVSVDNMVIQTALSVSVAMWEDANMSGIAGLCPNHPTTVSPDSPSLLDLLEPKLDDFVFTADLRYHATGRYRFGHVPPADYEGDVHWANMNRSSLYWQFDINGIHVAGAPDWLYYPWPVIADTGTTLMLMQPDLCEMYWSRVPGAYYDEWYDSYNFPCNQTDSLPDWEFEIAGLRGKVPGRYFNFENISETECYGGMQPFEVEKYGFGVAGDVFLKSVYAVFDVQNKTVGFANKKLE